MNYIYVSARQSTCYFEALGMAMWSKRFCVCVCVFSLDSTYNSVSLRVCLLPTENQLFSMHCASEILLEKWVTLFPPVTFTVKVPFSKALNLSSSVDISKTLQSIWAVYSLRINMWICLFHFCLQKSNKNSTHKSKSSKICCLMNLSDV